MLDLRSIIADIAGLVDETSQRSMVLRDQIVVALEQANIDDKTWAVEHADRIEHANTKWLTARPQLSLSLAGAAARSPGLPPERYTAISVDGSQIPLDRHEVASCYVLNVGRVAIHYGCGDRPILDSSAKLYFRDENVLLSSDEDAEDVGNSFITDRDVSTRRSMAEMEALKSLIADCAGRPSSVAFVDGPLILWTLEAERGQRRSEGLRQFLSLLDHAKAAGVPIVGYLSRPASREVIGALRVSLCPEQHVLCKACPHRQREVLPCSPIDRLRDADLFRVLLSPGSRSGVFRSSSRVLRSYTPADNRIAFFYLNTGSEIARLDIPLWVANDARLLDLCHAVALDQSCKGAGYPICLTEAHEQAVVTASDRSAFFRLVERQLVKADIPAVRTAKSAAKRRPIM